MHRGLIFLAVITVATLAADVAAALAIEVREEPVRPFGYVVGDTITRRLVVHQGEIDRASVPKPGRVDGWLTLRGVEVGASGPHDQDAVLTLEYQVMSAPVEVRTISLPALRLGVRRGEARVEQPVGALPVTVAPLTPESVPALQGLEAMRPDVAPAPITTDAFAQRMSFYGIAAALLAAAWFAHRVAPAWLRGRPRPFGDAYRAIRRLARRRDDADAFREGLRRLHAAFDASAGSSLFATDIAMWIDRHPRFAPARTEAERFFAVSREEFFGASAGAGDRTLEPVLRLAAMLRDLERGARWRA